jgi:hypothetical protein
MGMQAHITEKIPYFIFSFANRASISAPASWAALEPGAAH